MKVAFITSEYNPFHKGHAHQINILREEYGVSHVIACMSGNFVQRGFPAIFDKYTRADLAVKAGADLVIELPTVFSVSSAEFFSEGAIKIAKLLNIVDCVSFGAESTNKNLLERISTLLIEKEQDILNKIQKSSSTGLNFPILRSLALSEYFTDDEKEKVREILESPNNILAIEYIKAQKKIGLKTENIIIKRQGAGYHDIDYVEGNLPSASMIRKLIADTNFKDKSSLIPSLTTSDFERLLEEYALPDTSKLKDMIYYKLLTSPEDLNLIPEAKDGLSQRIINNRHLLKTMSLENFILQIKTKKYTYTRISRLLIQFYLGFNEEIIDLRRKNPNFIKILALNEKGSEIIKASKKNEGIKLVHSYKNLHDSFINFDEKASSLYSILTPSYSPISDYERKVKVIKTF